MAMKIYKVKKGILVEDNNTFYLLAEDWDKFINDNTLLDKLNDLKTKAAAIPNGSDLKKSEVVAPIQNQEVWASGVTYINSKMARQEESKEAGGGEFYARVYNADRPELFFKATPHRVVGPGERVRIRKDSLWNVPEPELTLVITSQGKIIGYTIGNDMSSRSIEGENPLYLPQAKTYDGCAALGPCIYVTDQGLPTSTEIELEIFRSGERVFNGTVGIDKLKRKANELVSYLFMECSFPYGCFLMTGTGIVPPREFTLQKNDEIHITIEPIGTLINTVA